jgi:hypothetical protein
LIPPTAFFAPSLDDLGAVPAVVEVDSRDETAGRADPGVAPARREDEVTVRDAGLAPMDGGGVADLGALGAAAAFGFSLSHVEKKSSAGSGLGVAVPRGVSSSPSMWIPCGFLSSAGSYCTRGEGLTFERPRRYAFESLPCTTEPV